MSEPANIFSFNNGKQYQLSEEKLQAYLDGQLNAEEQHEVELWLAEEGLESDAVEGLQPLSKEDVKRSVSHLNRQLNSEVLKKKRKRKNYYKDKKWVMAAIFIVLVFCLLAYVLIHLSSHP